MRVRKLIDSFGYAIRGIIYTLKTQRNMRIHYVAGVIILILSLVFKFDTIELLILFFTISLVIITEMLNTAIEKAIDMFTREYHPLAEISKNVAAGAVLVASINSLIVAYLLFYKRLNPYSIRLLKYMKNPTINLTIVSLVLIMMIIIVLKTAKPFKIKGEIISGHATIAFSMATLIALIGENILLATLSYLIGFLVAESRIASNIHSTKVVFTSAILGILITILMFQLLG